MNLSDLSSFNDLDPILRKQIVSYQPGSLSPEQWQLVRCDVVDLVARCLPKTKEELNTIVGSVCRFLSEFATEVDEINLWELLDTLNVTRALQRYEAQGMAMSTRGQHQLQLRRFLRLKANQPARVERHKRIPRVLSPYSADEITRLVSALSTAPMPVQQVGFSALMLGIGNGIVLPAINEIQKGPEVGLLWKGMQLDLQVAGLAFLPPERISTFSAAQWEMVRRWLLGDCVGAPDLRGTRLRDTWLVGPLQDLRSAKSVCQIMGKYGVGRRQFEHVAAQPCLIPVQVVRTLLRDF